MSDVMRPIAFASLMQWLLDEWLNNHTIFAYPLSKVFQKKNTTKMQLFDSILETPLGPAAGPHTQMTQNIIVAYLAGGRFFELKTVQKLDRLQIPRPCIEAQDEGYNVEWSQELRIEQSFDEYLKAWFALHFLQAIFFQNNSLEPGFIFNMSVGYDLAGIQSPKMDWFINSLKDASLTQQFNQYRNWLLNWLESQPTQQKLSKLVQRFHLKFTIDQLLTIINNISPNISNSVTVSTMHGCPPDEIEAICNHLLKEKKLHTFVKLNPTLLGFNTVNKILMTLGYHYLQLDEHSFENDLQYHQAIPILKRLQKVAAEENLTFGVKLSNTLGVKNTLKRLPGNEMYLSGRALFPLTINLAWQLAKNFDGDLKISYSGGATINNVVDILQTGIFPVTLVTDLLKPGGYARLEQMTTLVTSQNSVEWFAKDGKIHLQKLKKLAQNALENPFYQKKRRAVESIKINKTLPIFDCYLAPCEEACPIHQDVGQYIRLVEQQRYLDAFKVIIETNPLPHITGCICDHQCMYHCTRWDYEDPVYIREMKKVAAEKAWHEFVNQYDQILKTNASNGIKVAVVGAGPAGLSAAYFLRRAGFEVTVFEKEDGAGGVVRNVIPDFRLPQHAIERDVDLIANLGVTFKFGIQDLTIEKLKAQGFKYIFLGIGAGKSKKLPLPSAEGNVIEALDFLKNYKAQPVKGLGKRVAVIGGGNSAMDAARAAKRCPGVEQVFIIYRRTKQYMPADREEFEAALNDGVQFLELLLPVDFKNGHLTCQKMRLTQKEKDGRRSVEPIANASMNLPIDTVISAIGEEVDHQFLKRNGIKLESIQKDALIVETNIENVFIGGDARRGPSTIVESIADGKLVAELISQKEGFAIPSIVKETNLGNPNLLEQINLKKGQLQFLNPDPIREAARCLSCDLVCDKCVEVCPNRANFVLPISSHKSTFKDANQIIHLDALCNECGNCETFCPYQGKPYEDKITVFWNETDFQNSSNDGFLLTQFNGRYVFKVRFQGAYGQLTFNSNGQIIQNNFPIPSKAFDGLIVILEEILNQHRYLLNI